MLAVYASEVRSAELAGTLCQISVLAQYYGCGGSYTFGLCWHTDHTPKSRPRRFFCRVLVRVDGSGAECGVDWCNLGDGCGLDSAMYAWSRSVCCGAWNAFAEVSFPECFSNTASVVLIDRGEIPVLGREKRQASIQTRTAENSQR